MAYADFVIQRDLNFTIRQGDIFVIMGGSGCGKSTLLNSEDPQFTIDLLDPELQLSYNKNPNLLRQQVDDIEHGENQKIFIDEISKY